MEGPTHLHLLPWHFKSDSGHAVVGAEFLLEKDNYTFLKIARKPYKTLPQACKTRAPHFASRSEPQLRVLI
jgi:hypothetical protein